MLMRWIGRRFGFAQGGFVRMTPEKDFVAAPPPDVFTVLHSYGDAMRSVPRRERNLDQAMRSWSPSFTHQAAVRRALATRNMVPW